MVMMVSTMTSCRATVTDIRIGVEVNKLGTSRTRAQLERVYTDKVSNTKSPENTFSGITYIDNVFE